MRDNNHRNERKLATKIDTGKRDFPPVNHSNTILGIPPRIRAGVEIQPQLKFRYEDYGR